MRTFFEKTLLTIISLLLIALPAYAGEAVIFNMRIGPHQDYHRFVVELSENVVYKVNREGNLVTILMNKVRPDYPRDGMPSSSLVKVKGLKSDLDGAVKVARLDVIVADGARVKQTNWDEPFRIILDVYPVAPSVSAPAAKKVQVPEEFLKAARKTVTFNDGWRWTYRKKVMELLSREMIEDEYLRNSVFKNELNLKSSDKGSLLKEAEGLINILKVSGDKRSLDVLKGISAFFENGEDAAGLEAVLRLNPDTGFTGLGQFLLGSYYERKGFYPEAHGYYSVILRGEKAGFARSAALFQRGRLLFYAAKYGEAKKTLKMAHEAGFPGAGLWLADTLMIKGEFEEAWDIFKKEKDYEKIDSLSLMSLGDIYIIKENFDGAREVFEKLRARYVKDELISTFFALKAADAFLAEGRKAEAERTSTNMKEMLKGEGWAIATLSLADSLALGGDKESLEKAGKLYKRVADGSFLGSEAIHLSLIDTLIRAGNYREAMDETETFSKDFPTSVFRADLQQLTGRLVYLWLDDLYSKNDYAGVVDTSLRYGSSVPFGKKAGSYLKTGKSFVALGLVTDAIESLDAASKIGSPSIAEEAMMELGRVYLSQKDTASTERLYKAFLARFPNTRYREEVRRILLKTAFLEKDYSTVALSNVAGDAETLLIRAKSLARTGKHKEAVGLFEKAAALFEARGEIHSYADASIGMADSGFSLGNFSKALDGYKKASVVLKDGDDDKSWALYRMAQCYLRLDRKDESNGAARELKGLGDGYGQWATTILSETPKSH